VDQLKPEIPERGSRSLRLGRWSVAGGIYFITTSCHDWQKLFLDPENVRVVFDCLDWLVNQGWIDLRFAIAMPDHLHLVLQLVGSKSLSDVMASLKRFAGRKIRGRTGLTVPVWQEQYYDHLIGADESLHEIVKYCWFNPVRKGMVSDPKDYPHWRSKYELE
jgi:REP element-mobilizing transposase RayT